MKSPINYELCVICKTSRNLCGQKVCPLLSRWSKSVLSKKTVIRKLDNSFAPPSFFVGRVGYPNINAGPMLTPEKIGAEIIDNTSNWVNRSLEEIIDMRISLFRTKSQINVKKPLESPIIERSHELLLGLKPIDVEIELEKEIIPRIQLDNHVAPQGPTAPIKKLQLTENQKPLRPIEKVYYDTDLKAVEAVKILGKEKLNTDTITRIFSAGMLGIEKSRKLVPTRWSITAVDDILSKNNISQIKKFQQLGEFRVFHSYFFGNRFAVILIPDYWSYEMIEVWFRGAYMNPSSKNIGLEDYEGYKGRKTYATNISGAYYAARLSVTNYLLSISREAQAIVLREIDQSYRFPLGVWIIREGTRIALQKNYEVTDNIREAFELATKDFITPKKHWIAKSRLHTLATKQRRITEYI